MATARYVARHVAEWRIQETRQDKSNVRRNFRVPVGRGGTVMAAPSLRVRCLLSANPKTARQRDKARCLGETDTLPSLIEVVVSEKPLYRLEN